MSISFLQLIAVLNVGCPRPHRHYCHGATEMLTHLAFDKSTESEAVSDSESLIVNFWYSLTNTGTFEKRLSENSLYIFIPHIHLRHLYRVTSNNFRSSLVSLFASCMDTQYSINLR